MTLVARLSFILFYAEREQADEKEGPVKKKQKSEVRPYKEDLLLLFFLKFGFVNCSDTGRAAILMCVICGEKLANESLEPSKVGKTFKYTPCRSGGQTVGSRNPVISSGTQQKRNTRSQIALGVL